MAMEQCSRENWGSAAVGISVVLQAGIAIVNVQSVEAVQAEMKRRAVNGN